MKKIFTLLFTIFSVSVLLAQTVDLSTYVRVGRYDLPEPTRTTPPVNSLLAQEVSAVTYNWDTQTLFVVGDGGTSVVQVSKTGQLINSMTLAPGSSPQGTTFYDPEGLTYVGNGQFVMSEERDRQAVLFTYVAGGTLTRAAAQTVKLGTFVQNIGLEGLTYDPLSGGYIFVKEITPLGIFQTGINFSAGTATNGSATTENSVNLFDPALANLADFADVFALSNLPALIGQPNYGNLLVLSQEAGKIVNIDRSGNISSSLTIVSDPGNPLTVAAQQHEGLTMDRDGNIYVVSENGGGDFDHPQLWVYAPAVAANQAPTAISLSNVTSSIAENTGTLSPVKVADIAVTDDGQGTNNLTISGADAAFFQVTGSALFIKAGTVLDFETKTSYSITVNVDDASVGNTPDASTNYTLSVTDVLVENPVAAALTISEVAPWSSGNSPVGADWFEVTNNGNTAINISGWKVDDNSNVFVNAVALNGIASIAPGESVIFLETSSPSTVIPTFLSTWFGANPPAGLQVGSYTGSGVGLSTGGDAVNLFDAAGTLQAKVTFGASPAGPFPTFNNAAGLNNTTISQLSSVGVNSAFAAVNDAAEIGSPGTVGKILITEVAPWSSGNSPVGADWFEVTNTKAIAVDITGWKVDDNSGSPAAAVALNGITTIAPGESVIFIESATPATVVPLFLNTWFRSTPPTALKVGTYTGSGVGLGTGGDAVNLYNSSGLLQSSVLFGASSAAPYRTFDNAAGLNNTTISQLSQTGINGAFVAKNDVNEIGSPGTIVNIVCPIITVSASAPRITCPDSTTTVTVTATGGILPYAVSGSPLITGSGTKVYTVTDAKGCTGTVTIIIAAGVDSIAPSIIAPDSIRITLPVGATTAPGLELGNPITADNCGVAGVSNNAPSAFPIGTTIVTWTVTDASGNTATALQTVVVSVAPAPNFTLQILHASDFEASVDAVNDAPRFAAIVDTLEHTYPNSITLSSGDNFIPSPFSYSGEDPRLVPAYKNTYSSYYNSNVSVAPYDLRAGIGRADISILNFIGIEASVLGNHDFDFGTSELRNIIGGNISGSSVRWFGAQFPYLSSNLNFTSDANLAPVFTANRLLNTAFTSTPANTPAQIAASPKLAPSCVIVKNGEKIGIVGVTTPILAAISSPGATTVKGPGAGIEDMTLLATIVQPYIDSMINLEGCNKIILLSHLQQIVFEKELATKLSGVDIIIGGGSNTLFADATDRLRAGDVAEETYPFFTTGLDANPIAIVNTDGNYKYVGRLVIDFDPSGIIIPSSVDPAISGAYAADDQGVNDVWGANAALAFAEGTRGKKVKELCDSIGSAIQAKDGNLFGKTSVFLEGRRNFVRTEETNLGNVSAEANLWMAKFYDPATTVSIKNGGGIRSLIGNVEAVGNVVTLSPPLANPAVGKQLGDISQLDIENSLRFNNQLSLVTVSAQGLRRLLEHGVAATAAGATPGQFPQIAGVRFSYNPALPVFSTSVPGSGRLLNAAITNEDGTVILDTLVLNGVTYGDTSRTIRVVTLNFLAGGGDSYPFPAVSSGRVDINTVPVPSGVPGVASFTNAGSEQDAFAEFMKSLYSLNPYAKAETPVTRDFRIQNLALRSDSVFNQRPSVSITSPTAPANFTTNSTISALVSASDADGTIAKVELFVNGTLFGTDSTAPYTFTGANVEAGVYKVTAKAIDNLGASAETDTLLITVEDCTGSGSISGEGFTNIPGDLVSDLTSSPAFISNTPAITAALESFEYLNITDNYGARVRGYICAPVSGNYTFSIAADDQAGLYLSTDANPANKVLVAYTESNTGFRQWNKFSTQQSAPIALVKGARYYVETLHKEANGPDHLSVGWKIPGGAFEGPVSGSRLSPFTLTTGGRVAGARAFATAMQGNTIAKDFKVTVAPNPSANYFTLSIKSNLDKAVSVRIMDAAGRLVEKNLNAAPNSTMQVGERLLPGVYFVEVLQGDKIQRLKLVKQ